MKVTTTVRKYKTKGRLPEKAELPKATKGKKVITQSVRKTRTKKV